MPEKKKKPQRVKPRLPRGFVDRSPEDIRAIDEMVAKIRRTELELLQTTGQEPTDVLVGEMLGLSLRLGLGLRLGLEIRKTGKQEIRK